MNPENRHDNHQGSVPVSNNHTILNRTCVGRVLDFVHNRGSGFVLHFPIIEPPCSSYPKHGNTESKNHWFGPFQKYHICSHYGRTCKERINVFLSGYPVFFFFNFLRTEVMGQNLIGPFFF